MAYGCDLRQAAEIITGAVAAVEAVATDPAPRV